MTALEMKDYFDLLYNNSASNASAPLGVYEISLYLTKAQEELVKNKIQALGNKYQAGAEDSNKRDLDLGNLVTVKTLQKAANPTPLFDTRVGVIAFLNESAVVSPMKILNESIIFDKMDDANNTLLSNYKVLEVVQISYKEYERKLSTPYPYPLKNQAWKIHSNVELKSSELVPGTSPQTYIDKDCYPYEYIVSFSLMNDTTVMPKLQVRYIRKPNPIIVGTLPYDYTGSNQLTIDGKTTISNCELDAIVHDEIVQRAVELAKGTYSYDDNGQAQMNNMVQLGQRSE